MDTVNNLAGAASRAIWGENNTKSGTEPTSGEQGKGTVNDPYDHGNEEQNTEGLQLHCLMDLNFSNMELTVDRYQDIYWANYWFHNHNNQERDKPATFFWCRYVG